MSGIEISRIELLALKKLALVSHALELSLTGTAQAEQTALVRVLFNVIDRAESALSDPRANKVT